MQAMRGKRGRHAIARGLLICAMGSVLVLAACEAKVPTAAEVAAMDVAGAEKRVAQVRPYAKWNGPYYLINGQPASAEQAHALSATRIGSINIVKSELPSGRDTILVSTTDWMSKTGPSTDSATRLSFGPLTAKTMSAHPLILIDGKKATQAELAALLPSAVTIQVYKGPNPSEISTDPAAKNGVIIVETNRAKKH
jgi:hypothetical protein